MGCVKVGTFPCIWHSVVDCRVRSPKTKSWTGICVILFISITFMYSIIICIMTIGSVTGLGGLEHEGSSWIFCQFFSMDPEKSMVPIVIDFYAYTYHSYELFF